MGSFRIEWIPLVMNIAITGYYVYAGDEMGKILYWSGAVLVTTGLLFMKG